MPPPPKGNFKFYTFCDVIFGWNSNLHQNKLHRSSIILDWQPLHLMHLLLQPLVTGVEVHHWIEFLVGSFVIDCHPLGVTLLTKTWFWLQYRVSHTPATPVHLKGSSKVRITHLHTSQVMYIRRSPNPTAVCLAREDECAELPGRCTRVVSAWESLHNNQTRVIPLRWFPCYYL